MKEEESGQTYVIVSDYLETKPARVYSTIFDFGWKIHFRPAKGIGIWFLRISYDSKSRILACEKSWWVRTKQLASGNIGECESLDQVKEACHAVVDSAFS